MDANKDLNLVAQINTFNQYAPDDFERVTEVMIITPETTVGEILDWWSSVVNQKKSIPFRGPIHIVAAHQNAKV